MGGPLTAPKPKHVSHFLRVKKNDLDANRRTALGVKRYWDSLTPEQKRRRTANGVKALLTHAPHRVTRIEDRMAEALDRRGIVYGRQYRIGRYHADFFIPQWNLVLECDGDYWHSLPKHQVFDRQRDAVMREMGYQVVRIWEHAIKADVDQALAGALDAVT
jgi:very-short-patch-repair endonuclease